MPADSKSIDPNTLEALRVGEPFKSRKNRVFRFKRDGGLAVAKIYRPDRASLAKVEFDILAKCRERGVSAPDPIALGERTVIMQFVDAENLSDLFDRMLEGKDSGIPSTETRELMIQGIASWLHQFHRAMGGGMARGDSTLRNFLVSQGKIIGLDFEESGGRDPLSDLGEVAANILGMRPTFVPERFELVRELADEYWHFSGADRWTELPSAIADALEHYAPYRPDGENMRAWANRLRLDGFPSRSK